MYMKTESFNTRDGHQLSADVFSPEHPSSIIVFHIHGGAFSSGTRKDGASMAIFISETCNCTVYVPDFRKDQDHAHNDIADAISELRKPDKSVYVSGSSSGGWFAMIQASPLIDGVILWCPIVDPPSRERWLETSKICVPIMVMPREYKIDDKVFFPSRGKAEKILSLQRAYFLKKDDIKVNYPLGCKSLMIAGGRDENVPIYILNKAMSHITTTLIFGDGTHKLQQAIFTDFQQEKVIKALHEFIV